MWDVRFNDWIIFASMFFLLTTIKIKRWAWLEVETCHEYLRTYHRYDKSYEKIDDYKAISHSVDVYSRIKYGIKAINRGM